MMLALELSYWQFTLLKTVVVLSIIPAAAIILGYVFLLKMMAHMQSRLGPWSRAASTAGSSSSATGSSSSRRRTSSRPRPTGGCSPSPPSSSSSPPSSSTSCSRPGPDLVVQDLDVGIFYALAVSSLSVIGVLMAGWASANKYSLLGALRAAGQLIAYELPLVLAVVGVVIQAGTMSLQGIVHAQADGEIFGIGLIGNPFILTQFVGFVIFLAAAQAELTQTPFDMPVAESELVAGLHDRVLRLPLPVLLHGRVRHRLRPLGHRRHPLPRRLVRCPSSRRGNLADVLGPDRARRQDHARRLPDLLDPLHLPPLPRGPAPDLRLEVSSSPSRSSTSWRPASSRWRF